MPAIFLKAFSFLLKKNHLLWDCESFLRFLNQIKEAWFLTKGSTRTSDINLGLTLSARASLIASFSSYDRFPDCVPNTSGQHSNIQILFCQASVNLNLGRPIHLCSCSSLVGTESLSIDNS